jgi:hypothetical protein
MSNLVDVISPDGVAGTIPQERLAEALRDGGFKQAAKVVSPEGVSGSLPIENLNEALANGYKLADAPQPQTGFNSPAVQTAVSAATAIGHVGQAYARSYTGLLKGALSGIGGAVNDLLDPNK